MKRIILINIFFFFIPSILYSAIDGNRVAGSYISKIHRNNIVTLHLRSDHSVLIEDKFWGKDYENRIVNNFSGTWIIKGNELTVTYNNIEQILMYHEKLEMLEYGIKKGVRGLTTSEKNVEYGLLDSIKLWHQDEMKAILRNNTITPVRAPIWKKYGPTNMLSIAILVVLFSAILGIKKPIVGSITGAIAFPILCYVFLNKIGFQLLIYIFLGFFIGLLAGSLSYMIISGWKGKGHNIGPSYMSGFGGGKAARPGGIILSDEERKNTKK